MYIFPPHPLNAKSFEVNWLQINMLSVISGRKRLIGIQVAWMPPKWWSMFGFCGAQPELQGCMQNLSVSKLKLVSGASNFRGGGGAEVNVVVEVETFQRRSAWRALFQWLSIPHMCIQTNICFLLNIRLLVVVPMWSSSQHTNIRPNFKCCSVELCKLVNSLFARLSRYRYTYLCFVCYGWTTATGVHFSAHSLLTLWKLASSYALWRPLISILMKWISVYKFTPLFTGPRAQQPSAIVNDL